MVTNFLSGIMSPLIVPLILDTWDAAALGYLSTLMGIGMLVGTLVMSAWGGGKRKIYTIILAQLVGGIALIIAPLRASIPLMAAGGFLAMFAGPFVGASSQAIWMSKVSPDVQGRVFAVRRAIAFSVNIVAPLLAAPLADYVFKPGMTEGGGLAAVFGPIFGVGESRGVAVLISLTGVLTLIASIVAYTIPRLRHLELDLPDHELAASSE
jgi:MFS family permease